MNDLHMTSENALYQLLLDLFNADELRRWLRFDAEASVIVKDLPSATASVSELVDKVVDCLVRHGLVDPGFFARIRDARPRRSAEIDRVAALWQKRSASTSGSPNPQSPGTKDPQQPVAQNGGIFAPGATISIHGDMVAGDKHEVLRPNDRDPRDK